VFLTILSLDPSPSRLAARPGEAVYACEFETDYGGGSAYLVPGEQDPADLVGRQVPVVVDYRAISAVRSLEPQDSAKPRLQPAGPPGAFFVTGQIASFVWLDDEGTSSVVEVQLGGWIFSFAASEAELEYEYGQWVNFQVEDLTWRVLEE
jgi:hypothetical protein